MTVRSRASGLQDQCISIRGATLTRRGCSSVGRAPAFQAGCRRFEPGRPLSESPPEKLPSSDQSREAFGQPPGHCFNASDEPAAVCRWVGAYEDGLDRVYRVSGGRECPPLAREDATEKPETARAERTQDERLAFLQREPCRIRHDDPVCDEDLDRAWRRFHPEQSPGGSYLRPPACIVRRGDGIQEGRRHRRGTKGKTRGLARAAESTGQNRRDPQIETPHAPPYRAGIYTALLGEVSLRGAIGQIDGVFVGLREIRGRMPENEYETARLKRAGQSRLGRGICARLGREGGRNRKGTDCDSEGSEADAPFERCAHYPILRLWAAIGSIHARDSADARWSSESPADERQG